MIIMNDCVGWQLNSFNMRCELVPQLKPNVNKMTIFNRKCNVSNERSELLYFDGLYNYTFLYNVYLTKCIPKIARGV